LLGCLVAWLLGCLVAWLLAWLALNSTLQYPLSSYVIFLARRIANTQG
jgi:ACR3 family arsenite efflux pump ArsB